MFTNSFFCVTVIVLVSIQNSNQVIRNVQLPSFLKVCHQSDPELSKCIKKSVDQLRPLLVHGISEFGIPSLEPLIIPELIIDQGSSAVFVKSTYTDIKVYGASRFNLRSVKIDLNKDRVRIKLFLPHLRVESNYNMNGRILMMPISGKGESFGNYSNIDATVTMQGERIIKDTETFFHIKDFYVDFVLGHASIELKNLFNGDKQLADDLPSYFPRCHVDDPELEKCLIEATKTVRPHVKKGVPELNIPPMDPLVIPEVTLQQGTNAVNYKMKLINATIRGLGDYEFTEFVYDPKTFIFHGTSLFKGISLVSNYNIDGKILVAPINGKGTLKIQLGPSTGSLVIKGELVKRNGEDYYNIIDVKATTKISNSTGNFDGLFNGNEQLSQATNKLLNDNSAELIKEVSPAIEEVIAKLITRLMQGITTNVPYNKVLPPSH
ncbi:hypothetical protein ILUMI_27514 [Ignelater luminosus]|uniref:Uncharacterized protein n=1 Tax=Ignelater luminosus TaxID=2038154 RepID=A0A8K0FVL7_IGNLU|nr:hypothetical protein ILUMI_27514 [Ignelater luminosus]